MASYSSVEPWQIIERHGGSSPKELLCEFLAVTKMNANNCSYAGGWPITLSFSHRVGEVMEHLAPGQAVEAGYKYHRWPVIYLSMRKVRNVLRSSATLP